MKARAYQLEAVMATLERFAAGDQRTLCVVPTGGGKTVIAGILAKEFLAQKLGRIMVLCHREELIKQAAEKFERITGIKCGIEKSTQWVNELSMYGKSDVVVASIPSLIGNMGDKKRMHRFNVNEFALVWVDEAHHAIAGTWRAVVNYFCQNAALKVFGVTATPDRADKEAMSEVFQSVAYEYQLPDIIRDGYLVPIRQFSVTIAGLDFSKARSLAGDLNAQDLEAAMIAEEPLHGVVYATVEIACGLERGSLTPIAGMNDRAERFASLAGKNKRRQTLVFAVSRAHAERVAEIINRWIPESAVFVDGKITPELRAERLKKFSRREVQFLVNCMVATEGFDEPGVEIVAIARPTKSRGLYTQMVGRGTRPAEAIAERLGDMPDAETRITAIEASEKPFVEILDFVGNSGRHKLITTIDILGGTYEPEAVAIAAEIVKVGAADVTEVLEAAKSELQKRREAEKQRKLAEEERERKRQMEAATRAKLVATAQYHTQSVDAFDSFMPRIHRDHLPTASINNVPSNFVARLRAFKVPDEDIRKMNAETAGRVIHECIRGKKVGLRTYKQARLLLRYGYTKDHLHDMTFDQAKAAIEGVKANGWKRGVAA